MALGVCAELFFTDLGYAERIRRISETGYSTYELWFHDKSFVGSSLVDKPKDFSELAELNEELGISLSDFVFNHTDGGIIAALIDENDHAKLLDGLDVIIPLAKKVKCTKLICAAGNRKEGLSHGEAMENMIGGLASIAPVCAAEGITLLLEPFNTKVDHPDYFLDSAADGVRVLDAVGSDSVKLLYDIYHMQIMGGNILSFVRENIDRIGHFHIAGVPGRHEPFPCELDYAFLVDRIMKLGYKGNFGLEYWPTVDHSESLRAAREKLNV